MIVLYGVFVYHGMYIPGMCLCVQKAAAAAAAAAALVYCYTAAAAVRYGVPDGAICCRGSLNLSPLFPFSLFKRFLLDVPLGSTVAFTASICRYLLGNYGNARSQGGRQPATAKPPLYVYMII